MERESRAKSTSKASSRVPAATGAAAAPAPIANAALAAAPAAAPTRVDVATAEPGTTRALIWRLQSGGWTQLEAGNLAAIALGLRPARTGWTGAELDHLRFLKSLVTTGRVER
jgi:hypothetical protein